MQEWTPWLLAVFSAAIAGLSFVVRRSMAKQDAVSVKLDANSVQLIKLDGVSTDIAAVADAVQELRTLMQNELRGFDVRVTWLEAHAPTRQQVPRP